jgi:hypothetical protein
MYRFIFIIGFLSLTVLTFGQASVDPAPLVPVAPPVALPSWIESAALMLAIKFPVLLVVLSAIGAMRLVFKNLHLFLKSFVKATPWKQDDALLLKAEKSKAVKIGAYILDLVASIKLPVK